MKIIIYLTFSIFILEFGYSQNVNIHIKAGKAHYSVSQDLNEIQNDILSNYSTLNFKITDKFPSTIDYQIMLLVNNYWEFDKDLSTGIFFDISSTVGRIHYADYSGEFDTTQKISKWSLGIHIEKELSFSKRISFVPSLQFSYLKTRLNSILILDLSNFAKKINKTTHENSFAVEPGLNLQYKFYHFMARISSSYQLDLEGSHLFEIHSINSTYSFKPNWSGFRYGFSLGYTLF